jgi:hypothetical protein
MIFMANNTNNIRSSISITTNSRPNNSSLPSSGSHSLPRDNRDLLHPKVKIIYFRFYLNKLIYF